MMAERTREELLDELVRMTRARDLLEGFASDALAKRDLLAEGMRMIRDTTDGPGASIAKHVLEEAEIPEPEDG